MNSTSARDDDLPPDRVAGNVALDLANTFSWRGTAREIDHLRNVEAILAWARDAALIDAHFSVPKKRRTTFVTEIHRLRQAVDEAGSAMAASQSPPHAALRTIRDLAARSLARATLKGRPTRIVFENDDRIVGPVAWAALDLFRGHEL